MITLTIQTNRMGARDTKAFIIGEQLMADSNVTVSLKKTINMQNYNSLTVGVDVTLPNDEGAREEALRTLNETYTEATEQAREYLAKLEETMKNEW